MHNISAAFKFHSEWSYAFHDNIGTLLLLYVCLSVCYYSGIILYYWDVASYGIADGYSSLITSQISCSSHLVFSFRNVELLREWMVKTCLGVNYLPLISPMLVIMILQFLVSISLCPLIFHLWSFWWKELKLLKHAYEVIYYSNLTSYKIHLEGLCEGRSTFLKRLCLLTQSLHDSLLHQFLLI